MTTTNELRIRIWEGRSSKREGCALLTPFGPEADALIPNVSPSHWLLSAASPLSSQTHVNPKQASINANSGYKEGRVTPLFTLSFPHRTHQSNQTNKAIHTNSPSTFIHHHTTLLPITFPPNQPLFNMSGCGCASSGACGCGSACTCDGCPVSTPLKPALVFKSIVAIDHELTVVQHK